MAEYALSRTLSPAVIAEYRTQLPDKLLLQAKLREFYAFKVGDGIETRSMTANYGA